MTIIIRRAFILNHLLRRLAAFIASYLVRFIGYMGFYQMHKSLFSAQIHR